MKKFTLYFPEFKDYLLTKDVGIIPFVMSKYYGYKVTIICNSIKDEIKSSVKYLENLEVIELIDDEDFKSKLIETDILMLHGIYQHNLNVINIYKEINTKGKIYLKLDGNIYWMSNLNKSMNNDILKTLNSCDLITVESRRLQYLLNSLWNLNIKFIPNGYYEFINNSKIEYSSKENIILFAGRIGSPEKYNELLLEAFKEIAHEIPQWKINLVGSVEDSFLVYLSKYLKSNKELKDRIIISGKQEKEELKKSFIKAKVFCLTSLTEACANVFSEAIHNGCYLISSDVDGAMDVMDYCRYGQVFPIGDKEELKKSLIEVCSNEKLLKDNCYKAQSYGEEKLSWISLCNNIIEFLKENVEGW